MPFEINVSQMQAIHDVVQVSPRKNQLLEDKDIHEVWLSSNAGKDSCQISSDSILKIAEAITPKLSSETVEKIEELKAMVLEKAKPVLQELRREYILNELKEISVHMNQQDRNDAISKLDEEAKDYESVVVRKSIQALRNMKDDAFEKHRAGLLEFFDPENAHAVEVRKHLGRIEAAMEASTGALPATRLKQMAKTMDGVKNDPVLKNLVTLLNEGNSEKIREEVKELRLSYPE